MRRGVDLDQDHLYQVIKVIKKNKFYDQFFPAKMIGFNKKKLFLWTVSVKLSQGHVDLTLDGADDEEWLAIMQKPSWHGMN